MYLVGANTLAFSAGGTELLRLDPIMISTTVGIRVPAGSNLTPTYSFTGDIDTGMFNTGGDVIRFAAGTVETFDITSTGVVVTGKLTVSGAIDPTSMTLSGGGTAHFIEWGSGSTAPVSSGVGTASIRYNETLTQFEQSIDGAAYVAFGGTSFPLLAPDGTAAAPSYSFASDSTSGVFFDSGTPAVGVSAAGLEVVRFQNVAGAPQILAADSLFTAPVYSFASSPGTGIFLEPAAFGITVVNNENGNNLSVATFHDNAGTAQILAYGTSIANPAYSFAGDQASGMGGLSALGFNLVFGGVAIARIQPTGLRINVDNGLRFISQTDAAAGNGGTLGNGPSAGDPTFWVRVNVNGTDMAFPAWAV